MSEDIRTKYEIEKRAWRGTKWEKLSRFADYNNAPYFSKKTAEYDADKMRMAESRNNVTCADFRVVEFESVPLTLQETFEKYNEEYLKFENIEKPLHRRRDIAAYLLLDKLVPNGDYPMVSDASHDEIWLDVDPDKLAHAASEEDILYLVRCGVRLGDDTLEMFT
jgi:hypothetical protein